MGFARRRAAGRARTVLRPGRARVRPGAPELVLGHARGGVHPALRADAGGVLDDVARRDVARADAGRLARQLAQADMGADHAGQRVAVGDGDGGEAQLGRALDHLLRVRGPGEESEVRGRGELDGHDVRYLFYSGRVGKRRWRGVCLACSKRMPCVQQKCRVQAKQPCAYQAGLAGSAGVLKSQSRGPSAVSTRQ